MNQLFILTGANDGYEKEEGSAVECDATGRAEEMRSEAAGVLVEFNNLKNVMC